MDFHQTFDVIVVGGGHAGTEAALAAARSGAHTLLLTQNIETLGQMSCNPAIGGIGKGHLVKEIDALGGLMARAIDRAGIQFRILNASKGPAVRATRAQADRSLYKQAVRQALERQPNLWLFQQTVADLIVENHRAAGVVTQMGLRFHARCVVLTVGTFLGGVIHIGQANYPGGRAGDSPANALAARLRELDFRVGRLKTGTPPRLDGRTLDYSVMEEQPGDVPTPVFSFLGNLEEHPPQVSCHITRTNPKTHEIIRASLDRSPMFTGAIEGTGPRYCPSIEDKVVRFAERNSHQIFVEPEGLGTHEVYPNGVSTSLPFDAQVEFIHSIRGFENAHITRPGYAIEYDFFDPRGLRPSLETKAMENLFFAGQINGTTGYEEAAAQGLIAGLNAARKARGLEPWWPRRDEAYIGVMIDDLITRGTSEPYRMFTSRAEYRLLLREDNADLRLTPKGRELGLVDDERWEAFQRKVDHIERLRGELEKTWIRPGTEAADKLTAVLKNPLQREANLLELLRRPEVDIQPLLELDLVAADGYTPAEIEQVMIQAKYAGYIERQQAEIERARRYEDLPLPETLDYHHVIGLSQEVREKLTAQKPATLGQAARIPGVTPAAISLLLVHLKNKERLMATDLLVSGLEALGLPPEPERIGRIQQLYRALVRWNRVVNLTAVADEAGFITVHVLDSLAIHPYLHGDRILDVGSGAGFPGLPLAIFFPERRFVLLDAVAKKVRFIRQMALELGLGNVEAVHARVEDYTVPAGLTTIVTRAFTESGKAFALCRHLLAPGGRFLAMKGRYPEKELPALAGLPHRVIPLAVPGLEAERHLIEITQTAT